MRVGGAWSGLRSLSWALAPAPAVSVNKCGAFPRQRNAAKRPRAAETGCGAGEVRIAGTVLLPCAPASVAVARRLLSAELTAAGVFDGVVGDAVLVVSELLSNAIRHARPLPGAKLVLAWALDDGSVEVAVSDGGASTRPMTTQATVSSLGGRGLDIVEYLARSWGVRTDDTGLTVWAVVAVPTDRSSQTGTTLRRRGRRAG